MMKRGLRGDYRASVDLDTDGKIQKTIQTQFKGKTLICIAHRLRTIIGYDRILVMDNGKVAVSVFVSFLSSFEFVRSFVRILIRVHDRNSTRR